MKKNYLDYSSLTALVIDDAPIVITSIRIMLRKMGLKDENISHNKDPGAAIHQAKNGIFDIFICDYNFGHRLNGKQVFEEILHFKRLNSHAIFIMITGESSGKVVRSIIELNPDGYTLKPYSLHSLKQRIQTSLTRKQALHILYEINISGDFEFGVTECQRLLTIYPQYEYQIQQFLGGFYRRLKRLDEAKALYEDVLAEKDCDWANIGLANTLIDQKKESEASILLESILSKAPNNSNALVAMGSLNMYNDNIPAAIKHFSIASELIPGNSDRELMIANLCHSMEDYDSALLHYRTYFFSNKDTYRDTPTSLLNYVRAIMYKCETLGNINDSQKDKLKSEAGTLLSILYKDTDDQGIINEIELVGAHLAIIDKRLSDATVLLNKVYRNNNITCFYGQLYLCMLLDKLNYKKEGLNSLTYCQNNIALNEHELVAQSQLIIIQKLIDKRRVLSDVVTDLLNEINCLDGKDKYLRKLDLYIKIHDLAPYLQLICFEIISCLTTMWPVGWEFRQVNLLIEECNNTIEEMMSSSEMGDRKYYELYDLATRKIKPK